MPPAPSGVEVVVLNSTAVMVIWDAYMEGMVPGILTNFTIGYNQLFLAASPDQ